MVRTDRTAQLLIRKISERSRLTQASAVDMRGRVSPTSKSAASPPRGSARMGRGTSTEPYDGSAAPQQQSLLMMLSTG